ncbi:MAG: isoaspartyl peptidase/L-asparaginase, partial [Acidobacteriota bacterium]|nr:isoaspartyl peptidase/L-asparaginase [Acidobacteriota bacterium]
MLKRLVLVTATFVFAASVLAQGKIMLVIHGGAGTITRQTMTPEMEKQYRETLEQALRTGYAVLSKGGSSL